MQRRSAMPAGSGSCPCCGGESGPCQSCGRENHGPSMMMGAISGMLGFPAPGSFWGEPADSASPQSSEAAEDAGWRPSVLERIRASERREVPLQPRASEARAGPVLMTFADYTASDQSSSFGSHGTDQDAAACSQADPPTPPAAAPARRMVRHGPPAPPATAPTRSIPSYEVFSHPTTGDVGLDEAVTVPALRGKFSMRGPLFHAFVCYRVATEGPVGNRCRGFRE